MFLCAHMGKKEARAQHVCYYLEACSPKKSRPYAHGLVWSCHHMMPNQMILKLP